MAICSADSMELSSPHTTVINVTPNQNFAKRHDTHKPPWAGSHRGHQATILKLQEVLQDTQLCQVFSNWLIVGR